MRTSTELFVDEPRQLAFLATPKVVRALVPAGRPGVYMLLRQDQPFYIGRSDSCLRTRLASHPLLRMATHVTWGPCTTPLEAYRLEAAWFHRLTAGGQPINQIHPARPAGESNSCPFCSTGDWLAWSHLMRPRLNISAATPGSRSTSSGGCKNLRNCNVHLCYFYYRHR